MCLVDCCCGMVWISRLLGLWVADGAGFPGCSGWLYLLGDFIVATLLVVGWGG